MKNASWGRPGPEGFRPGRFLPRAHGGSPGADGPSLSGSSQRPLDLMDAQPGGVLGLAAGEQVDAARPCPGSSSGCLASLLMKRLGRDAGAEDGHAQAQSGVKSSQTSAPKPITAPSLSVMTPTRVLAL